jgi:hypothetical protein
MNIVVSLISQTRSLKHVNKFCHLFIKEHLLWGTANMPGHVAELLLSSTWHKSGAFFTVAGQCQHVRLRYMTINTQINK